LAAGRAGVGCCPTHAVGRVARARPAAATWAAPGSVVLLAALRFEKG